MRNLASHFEDALNPTLREANVIATPSLESHVSRLMDAVPGFQFRPTFAQSIAQESQQQDHAETKKSVEELEATLKALLKPEQHTGPVEVYLLDEAGLAAGDVASHQALQSAAQASLTNSSNVVAALTSDWSRSKDQATDPYANGCSALSVSAERHVIKEYLGKCGVLTFESFDALVEHLNQR